MDVIKHLNELENSYYEHKLNFDFANPLFKFEKHDETLLAYIKSYLENDDIDLKKLAIYIIICSNIKEKSILFNLFKTMIIFTDENIQKKYFLYLQNYKDEELEDFLYILSTKLKENDILLFVKILTLKYSHARVTLAFFILETYSLEKNITLKIYQYLFQKEDQSIVTIEDFYNSSKTFKNMISDIQGKEIVKINNSDLQSEHSLLKKRLHFAGNVAYFYNEDLKEYQIWVRLSIIQARAFEAVNGIDFNASIDFPKNLILHFLFHTEYGDNPFKIDLFFGNISDASFVKNIIENKKINFIFVGDDFIPIKSFEFVFSGPVLYKLMNQAWLSYYFKDFEWLRLKEALQEVEKGEFLNIDIPISIFRKVHLDLSLFLQIFSVINKSKNVENYIRCLNPIFYTKKDIENIPEEKLEKIVKRYIIELDKIFPYLLLFLSNHNSLAIKYMSYFLKEDFTQEDIKSEVIKRIVFIAGYLNSRGIIYYEHVKKIGKMFNIDLTEKFMNKLADSLTKENKDE